MPKFLFQRQTNKFFLENFLFWLILAFAQSANLDDIIVNPNYLATNRMALAQRAYLAHRRDYLPVEAEAAIPSSRYVLIDSYDLPNVNRRLLSMLAPRQQIRVPVIAGQTSNNIRLLVDENVPVLGYSDEPNMGEKLQQRLTAPAIGRLISWHKRSGFPLSDYTPTPCRWKLCASWTTIGF